MNYEATGEIVQNEKLQRLHIDISLLKLLLIVLDNIYQLQAIDLTFESWWGKNRRYNGYKLHPKRKEHQITTISDQFFLT